MKPSDDTDERLHGTIIYGNGAVMEARNIIGPGHLESVYQECFEIELIFRFNIKYRLSKAIQVFECISP